MARKRTQTSPFGASKREAHDASAFYGGKLYESGLIPKASQEAPGPVAPPSPEWVDRVYCQTAEAMAQVPESSIALAFTSPPYGFAQKAYEGSGYQDDQTLEAYLSLIKSVGQEVYRVLVPGGRYVVNIANQGRTPYVPLVSYFHQIHMGLGFLPMGEIIWQKARGASGSCAWGSWKSAKSPRLRDVHEYLLVYARQRFTRPDRGVSDIGRDEFMQSTLSVWEVPPESARRVGHPAPFPVALAERVIRLFSYVGDVVLDPFNGSGTTCVAAALNGRRYVGYDTSPQYCALAEKRIQEALAARIVGSGQ